MQLEKETIHRVMMNKALPIIPELQKLFMSRSPDAGEGFDIFDHYPEDQNLQHLRDELGRAVSQMVGSSYETSRGWVKSLDPGEGIDFHAHDGNKRDDPSLILPSYPVGVFYLQGVSPIVFFPYHQKPQVVDVKPGMFLVFRNDYHHYVPPAGEFRQSLAVNFKSLDEGQGND